MESRTQVQFIPPIFKRNYAPADWSLDNKCPSGCWPWTTMDICNGNWRYTMDNGVHQLRAIFTSTIIQQWHTCHCRKRVMGAITLQPIIEKFVARGPARLPSPPIYHSTDRHRTCFCRCQPNPPTLLDTRKRIYRPLAASRTSTISLNVFSRLCCYGLIFQRLHVFCSCSLHQRPAATDTIY